ncbi:MAG: TA system VapC family ribonuclease toxin [Terrimicrobiaceae bacterium]
MIVPDANLLIYAYDTTSAHHAKARTWWEERLSGDAPIGIPWVVVLAFTRLLTHPSVCAAPLTVRQVRKQVRLWLDQPHVRLMAPTQETLSLFFEFLEAAELGGNLSTDALIAAHAFENGAVIHTNDRDFDRFPRVKWTNPLV